MHTNYITTKRAKFHTISGDVNIPYGSTVTCSDGFLFWNSKPICTDSSQNAYKYFSQNDDGQGLLRGKLVDAILNATQKRDTSYQFRWNKIWADQSIHKYKRTEQEYYWLWNYDFYNAPIEDLQHIANLIGVKGVN